jgi:hypothetical protein
MVGTSPEAPIILRWRPFVSEVIEDHMIWQQVTGLTFADD